jgi:hypothetical protein
MNEEKKAKKKKLTPRSSSRRRRALPGPLEDRISSTKSKREKKKLDFETNSEQPTVKKQIFSICHTQTQKENQRKKMKVHLLKALNNPWKLHQTVKRLLPLIKVKHQRVKSQRNHRKLRN